MKKYKVYMIQNRTIIEKIVETDNEATDIWLNIDEFPNIIDVVKLS